MHAIKRADGEHGRCGVSLCQVGDSFHWANTFLGCQEPRSSSQYSIASKSPAALLAAITGGLPASGGGKDKALPCMMAGSSSGRAVYTRQPASIASGG